jgi:hypothetical protein
VFVWKKCRLQVLLAQGVDQCDWGGISPASLLCLSALSGQADSVGRVGGADGESLDSAGAPDGDAGRWKVTNADGLANLCCLLYSEQWAHVLGNPGCLTTITAWWTPAMEIVLLLYCGKILY